MTVLIVMLLPASSEIAVPYKCTFFTLDTGFEVKIFEGDQHSPVINCYVGTLLFLSRVAGLLTLSLCGLMYVIWMTPRRAIPKADDLRGQREIYATVSSGMIMFWLIAIEAVWVAFDWLVTRFSVPLDHAGKDPHMTDTLLATATLKASAKLWSEKS